MISFHATSDHQGHVLLNELSNSGKLASSSRKSGCNERISTGAPAGRLEIPSLGLDAPVVQGTGSEQLAVAVGHVPASSWPGQPGTSVLAAHDVSWFSRIDRLSAGQRIVYSNACFAYNYRVLGHSVVAEGAPVERGSRQSIVLDTCYPLDALWFTSQRYLVNAVLVSKTALKNASASPSSAPYQPPSPALPASLSLEERSASAPLGSLALSGSPSERWAQSMAPLGAEKAVLNLYEGALLTARSSETSWWNSLTLGATVPIPKELENATITDYQRGVSITLQVSGDQVLGATTSSEVVLSGGSSPGTYELSMSAKTDHTTLVLDGFLLQRLG